jgi:hypothetical protein
MLFKKKELTDDELLNLVAERFNLSVDVLTKEEEDKVYKELGNVENFVSVLNSFMSRDIKKHFKATNPAEQIMARGLFARALYIKARILKSKQKATEKDIPSLGKRYAK